MTERLVWYRSVAPLGPHESPRPSASRAIRNWLRSRLPDPDVRGKTVVLYARQGLRKKSAWAGMFSEFHHALGALAYAERCGAVAVRIDFRSALYIDPDRGPNWWTYFFCGDTANIRSGPSSGEVHLTGRLAKYGRYGGFCDLVNGTTPYLYPMTWGIPLAELHRLLNAYVRIRPEIRAEADAIIDRTLARDRFVVGVHYRGTDSNARAIGRLNDYRTEPVAYTVYADEVRRVLESAGARGLESAGARGFESGGARGSSRATNEYQLVIASDEQEFLEFMRREFGPNRVTYIEGAPRAHAGGQAIHFDTTLDVSNFEKGKSGLMDCLLLAATDYLVKGRSNLSDASLVFNPSLPYSFCLL